MLKQIQNCYKNEKVLFSKHARYEMLTEEFGIIKEEEVYETILNGKIIEDYFNDEPYPSCLIYGKTKENRPLHVVCAYSNDENLAIIVTVYQPKPEKWIDFERR